MRKTKRNATVAGVTLLIALVFTSAGLALADGQPILPDSFYGKLTVNGNDSPAGVTIVAKIAGVERGRYTTQQVGAYGSPGAFTPKLIVEGTKGDKEKKIHFYIKNYDGTLILASNDPTPIFKSGADVREVDLVFEGVQLEAAPASVITESATNVTTSSATLNASISFGDYDSVDAVFYYMASGATEWENTGLEIVNAEGTYSKNVTGLESDTTYEFKAAIRFDGLEAVGATKSFTTTAVVPPEKDFSISVSPTSGSVVRGESVTATVSLTSIAGFAETVSLSASGLPSGATESFSPPSGTPSFTSTLTISTNSTTPTGTYSITITGTNGGKTHNCTYTLTVTAVPVPDFSIGISPASGSVVQGKSTTATVSVSSIAEFAETVELSASGLPSGATASFSPPSGTPNFDSTLTISTASATPTGAYTITITGTGGGKTHSCTYSLTVTTVPVNQPPTADAGGPYSVDEEKTVKLDGTGSSDPDGDTLTYSWTITSDPTGESSLTNSDTATPTFHAPSVDSDTNVTVKLTVDDGHGHTDSDTATVTVKTVTPPPAEFPWPIVVAIIIVIVIVAICYWKREEISRRLRKVLKKE